MVRYAELWPFLPTLLPLALVLWAQDLATFALARLYSTPYTAQYQSIANFLDLSPAEYNSVQFILYFSLMISSLLSGHISDRTSRGGVIVVGGLVVAVGVTGYALCWNFVTLVVCQIFLGLGLGVFKPVAATLIAETLDAAGSSDLASVAQSVLLLGDVLGTGTSAMIYFSDKHDGWKITAALISATNLVAVAVFYFMCPSVAAGKQHDATVSDEVPKQREEEDSKSDDGQGLFSKLITLPRHPTYMLLATSQALFGVMAILMNSYLTLYLKKSYSTKLDDELVTALSTGEWTVGVLGILGGAYITDMRHAGGGDSNGSPTARVDLPCAAIIALLVLVQVVLYERDGSFHLVLCLLYFKPFIADSMMGPMYAQLTIATPPHLRASGMSVTMALTCGLYIVAVAVIISLNVGDADGISYHALLRAFSLVIMLLVAFMQFVASRRIRSQARLRSLAMGAPLV